MTELTLIILPTADVHKLDLLRNTDWQYVASLNDITNEDDIDAELSSIKDFFGDQNEQV